MLRSTVDAVHREDWVAEQVERGIDVLICNPDLVKTGQDLLEFPTASLPHCSRALCVVKNQLSVRYAWLHICLYDTKETEGGSDCERKCFPKQLGAMRRA